MRNQQIVQVLSQINSIKDKVDKPNNVNPATYQSWSDPPVFWDKKIIEQTLNLTLPIEIILLWEYAARVNLYVDITFNQWGTILWSPDEIVDKQSWKSTRFFNSEDFHSGDLLIGEFLGNDDLSLLIRCDKAESDFGKIMVASSLDTREDWYMVAPSINEFLEKMIASTGIMFWEYGFNFEKEQIEKWWAGEITKGWIDDE